MQNYFLKMKIILLYSSNIFAEKLKLNHYEKFGAMP